MSATPERMAEAKEIAQGLLEELGVANYVFEVEPRETHWEVIVECATRDEAWQRTVLEVDDSALEAAHEPGAARTDLLEAWKARLDPCRRR